MSGSVRGLEDLTRMILDAELAKLREISGEVASQREKLAALDGARSRRADTLQDGTLMEDLAFTTGVDARWQSWVAAERARINERLVEILTRREMQRARAKRAFGRFDAVTSLGERELKLRRQKLAQIASHS